jgi:hypothetical protein
MHVFIEFNIFFIIMIHFHIHDVSFTTDSQTNLCVLYSVITVHLFTVTIYIHQLDATLFKKLYSFLKHI